MKLNVKKRGNSLSVIIPKEMAVNLNVEDGDTLFATLIIVGQQHHYMSWLLLTAMDF
ncbi:transcriptional regulator/antitoxin, MazE [Gloeothece citriformis PCC 7424]|uniref:Transcriptional regulator/antitoxin, MazE n=1 Tax=Gloeothece citriformis (strain PCC 7424) TaxID=65393 RepID=B7KEK4_GLOC7|nr:MazE family transcriptional regulator [Gloeothece citriformis]ACK69029.1 transcriptional regulator/antitoxin, MazE [Gloeothece citriformis PCC 7424]